MKVIIDGNYLDPDGSPVIATQVPPLDGNYIGGRFAAVGWAGRWIKAASDSQAFINDNGGLKWDHGRTRHEADPGDWIVWTGDAYRIVPDAEFAATYGPVPFDAPMNNPPGQGGA